jgi:hypothetical protein
MRQDLNSKYYFKTLFKYLRSMIFFNLSNPSSCTMSLGITQLLMSKVKVIPVTGSGDL